MEDMGVGGWVKQTQDFHLGDWGSCVKSKVNVDFFLSYVSYISYDPCVSYVIYVNFCI